MQDMSTQSENSRASAFIFGVMCGAAVGAAVSLLLAPKSGPEMRQQVLASADRLRRKAGAAYDGATSAVSAAYDGATSAVNDVVARGKHAVEAGREAFEQKRPGTGSA